MQDGYTERVTGDEGVRVRVAVRAKASSDSSSRLEKEYFRSFLDVSFVSSAYRKKDALN